MRSGPTGGNDEKFMDECLALAARGGAAVSPNPMVGAVLVRGGRIISRGYHRFYGGPHAEKVCLESVRAETRGGTLYVNLEPCAHFGKTPPCVDLIIRYGIRRVVVAVKDPNELVAGQGLRRLRRAGIQVTTGVREAEARELNRAFLFHIVHRRPFVHVKIAQTLDGKIAFGGNARRWISCYESRKLVHVWRREHDAVLVGAGTVRQDDPDLTVRHVGGRNPAVVILDGELTVPTGARVLRTAKERRVILCASKSAAHLRARKVRELVLMDVDLVLLNSENTRLNIKHVLEVLYGMEIGSILVEGGREVFTQFLSLGVANMLSVFISPSVAGRGLSSLDVNGAGFRSTPLHTWRSLSPRLVGRDVLMQFLFS